LFLEDGRELKDRILLEALERGGSGQGSEVRSISRARGRGTDEDSRNQRFSSFSTERLSGQNQRFGLRNVKRNCSCLL
jgi:hypothetical protein